MGEIASVWTIFQYREFRKQHIALFGTQNWRSYAFLHAGILWRLYGDIKMADQMFGEALNLDKDNYGALFNQATILIQQGATLLKAGEIDKAKKVFILAELQLSEVQMILDNGKKVWDRHRFWEGDFRNEPSIYVDSNWYKAKYQHIIVFDALSKVFRVGRSIDLCREYGKKALGVASELVNELDRLGQPENRGVRTSIGDFIAHFDLLARMLKANIQVTHGDIEEATKYIDCLLDKSRPVGFTYRVEYNLACHFSRRGDKLKSKSDYQMSLDHLSRALERGGTIIDWAQQDPALDGLRDKEGEAFNKIIKDASRNRVIPQSFLLTDLDIIPNTEAARLKELKITNVEQLLNRATNSAKRNQLAQDMGSHATKDVIKRWAEIADLAMRINGIDCHVATRLESEGFAKLSSFCNATPEDVRKKLTNSYQNEDDAPDLETIKRWQNQAKGLKIIIGR